MWEKIKNFLMQVWVQILAWVFVVIGAVVLIIDGVTVADIGSTLETVAGILGLIGALITFIISKIKK